MKHKEVPVNTGRLAWLVPASIRRFFARDSATERPLAVRIQECVEEYLKIVRDRTQLEAQYMLAWKVRSDTDEIDVKRKIKFVTSMARPDKEVIAAQFAIIFADPRLVDVVLDRSTFSTSLTMTTVPLTLDHDGVVFDWGSFQIRLEFGSPVVHVRDERAQELKTEHNFYAHPHLRQGSRHGIGDLPILILYQELLRQHRVGDAVSLILDQVMDASLPFPKKSGTAITFG